jgi:pimeloyl-ACP methyl ester carboxylesterase
MKLGVTIALLAVLTGCGGIAAKYVHPASIGKHDLIANDAETYGFHQFEYHRADGRKRIAFLNEHRQAKGTLLYMHGNGMLAHKVLDNLEFLDSFGMDVVVMEYTGYGPHRGRPTDPALRKDVAGVIAVIKDRNPQLPIIMVGSSLGGSLAIVTAMDADVDGLVTLGAFTRTSDFASPLAGAIVEQANGFDALSAAEGVTIPWALVHCKSDDTVPLWMGRALRDARLNASGPHELVDMISTCNDHLVPFSIWKRAIKRIAKKVL